MSGQFDNLLNELTALTADSEALAKALPTDGEDDAKIQTAAGDEVKGKNGEGKCDTEDDEPPMAKSFKVKLEDGTEVEATDGAELIKSLTARLDASEGEMAKAFGGAVALIKSQSAVLKQQGELLKSLSEQVKKLGGEGRGRKAVVTVSEKQTEPLAKSESGMTAQQFLLKANSAFDGGKLSGMELTTIDVALRSGQPVDPALIQKVVG